MVELLAHYVKSLQVAPLNLADADSVYVDLRLATCREYLRNDSSLWEHANREVMKRVVTSGSIAYDIGANIGLHTALLSRLVGPSGKVVAFEPNPQLFTGLAKTCESLGNVSFLSQGLSNQTALVDFFVPADFTMASLHNWTSQPTTKIQIPVTLLDDLDLPPPNFIKCDVEGHELEVFQGAKRILREYKPVILFESYSQNSDDHLAAPKFLQSLDYQLHIISDNGSVTLLQSFDYKAADLLACPLNPR